jgi:hypothetical protein
VRSSISASLSSGIKTYVEQDDAKRYHHTVRSRLAVLSYMADHGIKPQPDALD